MRYPFINSTLLTSVALSSLRRNIRLIINFIVQTFLTLSCFSQLATGDYMPRYENPAFAAIILIIIIIIN